MRLSEVVRGPTPALARDSWEHEPLYLLDEFGAYVWGTAAGASAGDRSARTAGSYRFACQMLVQCRRLVALCRQRGYSHTRELDIVVESGAVVLDRLGDALGQP